MFCPVCSDEFRPGFSRCAKCNVTLVDNLENAAAQANSDASRESAASVQIRVPMAEYCGFLSLEEARESRDRLRVAGIRSEIVIREAGGSFESGRRAEEEYWLNVERDRYREVVATLGFDEASGGSDGETFSCGECGAEVADEESFCPTCGARFEDD